MRNSLLITFVLVVIADDDLLVVHAFVEFFLPLRHPLFAEDVFAELAVLIGSSREEYAKSPFFFAVRLSNLLFSGEQEGEEVGNLLLARCRFSFESFVEVVKELVRKHAQRAGLYDHMPSRKAVRMQRLNSRVHFVSKSINSPLNKVCS